MKFLLLFLAVHCFGHFEDLAYGQKVVIAQKQILFDDFPDSTNPSIIKVDEGYLMSFRYTPDRYNDPWVSYIGIVLLNKSFNPISHPQLLDTRFTNNKTQSQCEDARLFTYCGRIFLTYNDNMDVNCTTYSDRREIYLIELFRDKDKYTISSPLKLYHQEKAYLIVQKNWVFFEWNKKLLTGYSINPHEILYPNLHNGACYPCYDTVVPIIWDYGTLHGDTPPLLIDGEYLSFFHSGIVTSSYASWGWDLWHYFMGAFTFSASPPFEMTSYTPLPIVAEGFYTQSNREKRVIIPGGFVVSEQEIYLAYGKDDYEIWIATIDKQELKKILKPICKN